MPGPRRGREGREGETEAGNGTGLSLAGRGGGGGNRAAPVPPPPGPGEGPERGCPALQRAEPGLGGAAPAPASRSNPAVPYRIPYRIPYRTEPYRELTGLYRTQPNRIEIQPHRAVPGGPGRYRAAELSAVLNGAAAPAGPATGGALPGPARPGAARPGSARRPRGMEPFLGCTGAALLLCFSYAGLRPVEAGKGRRGPGRGLSGVGERFRRGGGGGGGDPGEHGWVKRGGGGGGCVERRRAGLRRGDGVWGYRRPGLCG